MTSIADLVPVVQTLLTETADQAGRDSGLIQRMRAFTGATFVQTLTFGWLGDPAATLGNLAQTAAAVGVGVTGQAIDARFSPQSADCLARVLAAAIRQAVAADPVDLALLDRFAGVVVIDGSVVGLPADLAALFPGGANQTGAHAALKIGVGLDLVTGRLDGPYPLAGRAHDRRLPLHDAPRAPGVLRLADLGFFDLTALADLGAGGAYWLTRVQHGTVIADDTGRRLDLVALLRRGCKRTLDVPILLGAKEQLPCRLLAERVPKEVAHERRQRRCDAARRRGQTVSPQRRALAAWTIYATHVPLSLLTVAEAMVVARARWQIEIELVFKLWKSGGKLDAWRSAKPWRVLTEVYAKLLALVIAHWVVVTTGWQIADRSMAKMAQVGRAHARWLASACASAARLHEVLTSIGRGLRAGCRVTHHGGRPSTYQRLCAVAA